MLVLSWQRRADEGNASGHWATGIEGLSLSLKIDLEPQESADELNQMVETTGNPVTGGHQYDVKVLPACFFEHTVKPGAWIEGRCRSLCTPQRS